MIKKLANRFILGVKITTSPEGKILEYIIRRLNTKGKSFFIVTPNPEILVYASRRPEFKKILNEAKIALPDGIGLVIAATILGITIKKRITGVDFMKSLCQEVSNRPITVGFLGGLPGVAEETAECLKRKYSGLKVVFADSEWPEEESVGASLALAGPVAPHPHPTSSSPVGESGRSMGVPRSAPPASGSPRQSKHIDLLFVAFGFPKQEEWIYENLPKIPVTCAMGVGGAFDYVSGRIPRAPTFVRKLGFEWFYRLIRQPWRIKRQIALAEFIFLTLKEAFKQLISPKH